MNIKQIEGFCELAKTMNFTRAADKMYITQSAFSRMIDSLEKEIGVTLIVRDKVNPRLTAPGEALLGNMQHIMDEYLEMTGKARMFTGDAGELTIGILEDGFRENISSAIRGFAEDNPSIKINLCEIDEASAFDKVISREIDLAVVVHYPDVYKNATEGKLIDRHRNCVVVNADNPIALRKEIDVHELRNEPFVLVDEKRSKFGYSSMISQCLRHGFTPRIVCKAPSISMVLANVEMGNAVTILHDSMKSIAGKNTVFVPLSDSEVEHVWCVSSKDNVKEFVSKFQHYLEENIDQTI